MVAPAPFNPTAVQVMTAMTATGTSDIMTLHGDGTVLFRVSGTFSALTATVQVSESALSTGTFTSVPVEKVTSNGVGPRQATISATGLYRVNVAGARRLRFNVSAFTGTSVTFGAAANSGAQILTVLSARRNTYRVAFAALATAASATDFVEIKGAASVMTRITRAVLYGTGTTAGTAVINALVRSTANTVGTSTAVTPAPLGKDAPAASSTAKAYTANPTTGTLAYTAAVGLLNLPLAASTLAAPLVLEFGQGDCQPVELNAATDTFALNGNGATLAAGAAVSGFIEFTEEL